MYALKTIKLQERSIKLLKASLIQTEAFYINLLKKERNKKEEPFSAIELQNLIFLCHPDKHRDSELSKNMTAKLIKLKEEVRKEEDFLAEKETKIYI